MELKNRIIEILEKSGLTPSEFADKIEVQRSAISHITSGRNKPSLEFLIKIKQAFPEIDTDWLVFGTENNPVLNENVTEKESEGNSTHSFPTLFELFETDEKPAETEVATESEIPIQENNPPIPASQKKIVRALLFFNDGTFEDFVGSVHTS